MLRFPSESHPSVAPVCIFRIWMMPLDEPDTRRCPSCENEIQKEGYLLSANSDVILPMFTSHT